MTEFVSMKELVSDAPKVSPRRKYGRDHREYHVELSSSLLHSHKEDSAAAQSKPLDNEAATRLRNFNAEFQVEKEK